MPTAILADDERLMREHLRLRLAEAWPELRIVAEARNGIEAVEAVARELPDLAFLDIRMPGKTGLEAVREIASVQRDGERLTLHLRHRPERLEISRSFSGRFKQM